MSAVLQIVGAAALVVGAGLVYLPAGWLMAGFLLILFGVAVELRGATNARKPDRTSSPP